MTTLGEKIRLLRLTKGLSQENLADLLKISTTAYGDIERNKTDITVSRLLKITEILEGSLENLLDIKTNNAEATFWFEKFQKLNNAYQLLLASEQQSNRPQIGFKKAS